MPDTTVDPKTGLPYSSGTVTGEGTYTPPSSVGTSTAGKGLGTLGRRTSSGAPKRSDFGSDDEYFTAVRKWREKQEAAPDQTSDKSESRRRALARM